MSRAHVFALPLLGALVAALAACGPGPAASFGPAKVDIPVSDGVPGGARRAAAAIPGRESPPPSGVAKDSPFPVVARDKLANGMGVAVVTSRALPIVQLRVVVKVGSGAVPSSPAAASLTGDMLKDGGTRAMTSAELLRRVETLGADLSVRTDFDATVLAMAIPKAELPEAVSLLAQVVREPRFDPKELDKLKARATDEAEDAARGSGTWTATRLVFRELFPEKTAYATYGLTPSEIARVDVGAVRDVHRRFYVPKGTTLLMAGDVDAATARALADKHFGGWSGGEPPRVDPAPPRPRGGAAVVVAHRPKSAQSDVYVATLAPPRRSEGWAAVRVANQVLGGGVASRLFADVREQRSLAYRTSAQILELASGEQPLVVYAGTETKKTAEAVSALLDNLARMTSAPPSAAETETARRYLADVFAIRMETIGSIADMVVTQDTFGLPDGYWDAYRKALRATTPAEVEDAAKRLYARDAGKRLVVVAGDADVIGPELARFGAVTVVDPEKEYRTLRTIPEVSK